MKRDARICSLDELRFSVLLARVLRRLADRLSGLRFSGDLDSSEAIVDTIPCQLSFVLSYGTEDSHDQASVMRGGIYLWLIDANQFNAVLIEFFHQVKQIHKRTSDTVESNDEDDVELVFRSIPTHVIERGTMPVRSGSSIFVGMNDLVTSCFGVLSKLEQLVLVALLENCRTIDRSAYVGADTSVKSDLD